jgi:hypothetical protein
MFTFSPFLNVYFDVESVKNLIWILIYKTPLTKQVFPVVPILSGLFADEIIKPLYLCGGNFFLIGNEINNY